MRISGKTLTAIYKKFGGVVEQWFSLISKSFIDKESQTDFMNLIKQKIHQIEL